MELEVAPPVPLPLIDFNLDSSSSTPYLSASSSPQRLGNLYFSAPGSPTRFANNYQFMHNPSLKDANFSSVPFDWEEKPGTPKNRASRRNRADDDDDDEDRDFAFDFSGQLETSSVTAADDLFYQGKIKPLKPPPARSQLSESETEHGEIVHFKTASSSPRSPRKGNIFHGAFSSPKRRNEADPFARAVENSRRTSKENGSDYPNDRGRERRNSVDYDDSWRKKKKSTRSLSPFRVSDVLFGGEKRGETTSSSFWSSLSLSKAYRKWKIKDLLFRSASEGRCTDKIDPALTKYVEIRKQVNAADDVRNASFRSTESSVGSRRGGRVPVSAHELHYTVNRAVSEEMKKKTFLPYKQGLLGCLGFNPSVHDISRGGGSMPRV